jgi:glycosyltransferase involved in cell wall biosynthesis
MMRVGIYLGNFSPTEGGGYSFQYAILQELRKYCEVSPFTFIVFYEGNEKIDLNPLVTVALQWSFWQRLKNKLKSIIGTKQSRFQYYLSQYNIDVVWFTSFAFEPVDLPYVYTVWDLQHRLQPYFPEVTLNGQWESREKMYQRALGRASIVLTGTDAGKNELMQFYGVPDKRIRKLFHPTPDLSKVSPGDISQKIPSHILGNYIFYPAQFWPHKNHIRILRALKELKEMHNVFLPVVFCGADKGNIEYIKQEALKDKIIDQLYFLGFVSQQELVSLYRNARALVFASFFGPENLPPLEAFSLGCPVIASAVEGACEQLGDAALYFNPGDHIGLSNQLLALLYNKDLVAELKQKGYARAEAYTTKHYLDDIGSVLRELDNIRQCWAD